MTDIITQVIQKYTKDLPQTTEDKNLPLVNQFPLIDTSFLSMRKKWNEIFLPLFAVVDLNTLPLKQWKEFDSLSAASFRIELDKKKTNLKMAMLIDSFLEMEHYYKFIWRYLIKAFSLSEQEPAQYYKKILNHFHIRTDSLSGFIDIKPKIPNVLNDLTCAKIGFIKTIFNAGLFLITEAESWTAKIPEKKDPFVIGIYYDYEKNSYETRLCYVFDPTIREKFCISEFLK